MQGSTAVADGVSQLRLAANVPIGAVNLPVDTSPQGGGTVSSLLSPNDTILIIGNRDGCGTPRLFQELRVTSVNDGTAQVVVSTPLQAAYSVIWPAGAFETNYGTQDQSLIIKLASRPCHRRSGGGRRIWSTSCQPSWPGCRPEPWSCSRTTSPSPEYPAPPVAAPHHAMKSWP